MGKKSLNITCKKATLLSIKHEGGKISFWENIRLRLHYTICTACCLFNKQSELIGKTSKQAHTHSNEQLSAEKKEQLKALLKIKTIILVGLYSFT
jgi:hypothetical protein